MPNTKISTAERTRLINFWNINRNYKTAAQTLGIKFNTAYKIIKKYQVGGDVLPGVRGGRKHVKLQQFMKNYIIHAVEKNPLVTLKAINANLRHDIQEAHRVNVTTISRYLDVQLYTVKTVRNIPADRNGQDVLVDRQNFARWFMETGIEANLIYIDESGINLWTRRDRGRARKGQRAYNVVGGAKGKNVTLLLAVSPTVGLLYHEITSDNVNRQRFSDFLGNVATHVDNQVQHIVILDNAAIHHNLAAIPPNFNLHFLPAYSPFLNVVEMAFSSWKALMKEELNLPDMQDQIMDDQAAANAGMNKAEWRLHLLTELAGHCLRVITQEKCNAWFRHTQTFISRCLDLTPIMGD